MNLASPQGLLASPLSWMLLPVIAIVVSDASARDPVRAPVPLAPAVDPAEVGEPGGGMGLPMELETSPKFREKGGQYDGQQTRQECWGGRFVYGRSCPEAEALLEGRFVVDAVLEPFSGLSTALSRRHRPMRPYAELPW